MFGNSYLANHHPTMCPKGRLFAYTVFICITPWIAGTVPPRIIQMSAATLEQR